MEEINHQMLYVESSIFARARVSYANEDGVSQQPSPPEIGFYIKKWCHL